MANITLLFSYYLFNFLSEKSYMSVYDLSSSKNIYMETILKFPNYQWSPNGISHNPNINREHVLENKHLPWVYTEFTQKWVDEEWVNSFPHYTEQILITSNFIPNFARNKIKNNIPLKFANQLLLDSFPEAIVEIDFYEIQLSNFECIEFSTNKDIEDYIKLGKDLICIFGESYITFDTILKYESFISIKVDKNTIFINEIESFSEYHCNQ